MPHRVYIRFSVRDHAVSGKVWVVEFLRPTLDRIYGHARLLPDKESVAALIWRTPTKIDLANQASLNQALSNGRGGLFLDLTDDQFRSIQR